MKFYDKQTMHIYLGGGGGERFRGILPLAKNVTNNFVRYIKSQIIELITSESKVKSKKGHLKPDI